MSLQWPVAKIRQQFVDYFRNFGHVYVPSSPSVPLSDPTLLFTNAGMNQFKDIFTGQLDVGSERGKIRRAVNSQKCIRAGGKHNDLEDVGRDTYHHTFFEMLGNWSFGDYFKEEAIEMAWKLLTEVFGLPKEQLYVTYFEGNEELGLAPDIEARDIWKRYVSSEQIVKGNMKDNFWEMGEVGPCGPCSEIHFDRLGNRKAAHLVNKDDPMVIEIWNIVFIQFCRQPNKSLLSLPSQHVDTGMGLERLTSILQNVQSNYDTDIWSPLFSKIKEVTQCTWNYSDENTPEDVVIAYRVIADHIRMVTVSIIDGATPDNAGRGYVIRRVIRRAIRFGNEFMGAKKGFFSELVTTVCEDLGTFFPEMIEPKNVARAKTLILDEEVTFAKTWNSGLEHFKNLKIIDGSISGFDAFILHDRYGFPIDLTCIMAQKNGVTVDMNSFTKAMEDHQKAAGEKAKAAHTFLDGFALDELRKEGVKTTNDSFKYISDEVIKSRILRVFISDKKAFVPVADSGIVGLLTDNTPFYWESGGQIYDTGFIITKSGKFEVQKVFCFGGYVCHIGTIVEGSICVDDEASMQVNYDRRKLVSSNHTMTHFLNHALRQCLSGNSFIEVNQRGSYVCDDFLRFDFSWNNKLDAVALQSIESALQKGIRDDLKVYRKSVPLKDALEIKSLRCMFDEKYGEVVIVVSIGISVDEILKNPVDENLFNYSIELCGGTHLSNLNQAQTCVISSEDALTKGVRRMVVFTGPRAAQSIATGSMLESELTDLSQREVLDFEEALKKISVLGKKLNESDAPLLLKLRLREEIQELYKNVNAQKKSIECKALQVASQEGAETAEGIPSDVKFYVTCLPPKVQIQDRGAIQNFVESFCGKRKIPIFVVGVERENAMCICVSDTTMLNAADWIKNAVGKGGGKPTTAQAGFSSSEVNNVVAKANAYAQKILL